MCLQGRHCAGNADNLNHHTYLTRCEQTYSFGWVHLAVCYYSKRLMLLDLPTETVLHIINQGLGPSDVWPLCLTCKVLNDICYSVSVWLKIATTISKVHPLPLPAFKSLQDLSLPELIAVCKRHSDILRNTTRLSGPEPTKHRRLEISGQGRDGRGAIHHFAFLPGGRYLIILHQNGIFTCWDILGKNGSVVIVTSELGAHWLHVLRLAFDPNDALQMNLTELESSPVTFPCDRMHIQDDLICCSGESVDGTTLLLLLDPINQRRALIDTEIHDMPGHWDSFTHLPHGIMFYREDGDNAYSFWYNDARKLLDEVISAPDNSRWRYPDLRLRPPDGSQNYTFDEESVLSGDREASFVTHPWNTPTHSRDDAVSILSISRAHGPRPGATQRELGIFEAGFETSHVTITQHWLKPASIPSLKGPDEVAEEVPRLRRWIHNIPFNTIAVGSDSSDIICPGSHGTHIIWLWYDGSFEPEMDAEQKLRLSMASFIGKDYPAEVSMRDICFNQQGVRGGGARDLDSSLRWVANVDVEDSHGIIGLATPPEHNGAPDGTDMVYIHLLYM
ncbi:hypothetical protein FRB94_003655 [Tulasnella sp. JGI-2019a]|nr:hypothetical protein FRB94_003655 [Tulasnella sp. JGI-2019a]